MCCIPTTLNCPPTSCCDVLRFPVPVPCCAVQGRFYYIDVYNFPDEALLRRLTPPESEVPKGYKDEDD